MTTTTPTYLAVITCDGDFDQICEGKQNTLREVESLRDMGFVVKTKVFDNWKEAEDYADKLQGDF